MTSSEYKDVFSDHMPVLFKLKDVDSDDKPSGEYAKPRSTEQNNGLSSEFTAGCESFTGQHSSKLKYSDCTGSIKMSEAKNIQSWGKPPA